MYGASLKRRRVWHAHVPKYYLPQSTVHVAAAYRSEEIGVKSIRSES